MNAVVYPPAPVSVDTKKLEPSLDFKKQVGVVIGSIALFFITYILLIILAIALVAACFYGSVFIVSSSPSFITLMLALGLIVLGIAVFIFLFKFIFTSNQINNDAKKEIIESDEPLLFDFIRKITQETGTPFPKKIFLSPDVNASVFYNSSFWSMFLPVKKNLEIGIGFVNSVNISEFKAVMAHEFGHFSQRSMKLGSFTYNVNKVIYNMLYDNQGYSNFLQKWGSVSGYFALFASITAWIANGIQSILRFMYTIINKNYMALSREMEFHADAIAASVAGGNNLSNALARIEIAASCYNTSLEHADVWLKEKKISKNIFAQQQYVFSSLAKQHQLEVVDNLPVVTTDFIRSFSSSKIHYKNQWASHPSLEDRSSRMDALQMNCDPLTTSAWVLFKDPESVQKEFTQRIYINVAEKETLQEKEIEYYQFWYEKRKEGYTLPDAYKGFYDGRIISTEGWDFDFLENSFQTHSFDDLFNETNSQLQEQIAQKEGDIAILKSIQNNELPLKTFDYDGEKMDAKKDTDQLINTLTAEIHRLREQQQSIEKQAYVFFKKGQNNDLRLAYEQLAEINSIHDKFNEDANHILSLLQPLYHGNISIQFVLNTISNLKENHEKKFKEYISVFIQKKYIGFETKENLLDDLIKFKNSQYQYFANETFFNNELNELSNLLFRCSDALQEHKFKMYKDLLVLQLKHHHQENISTNA